MSQALFEGVQKQSKQAVIYLRVSTEEQAENYSLDTQQEICTKDAERKGYKVIKVFKEEGKSAKTIQGRPALIEMLEFCRKHKKEVDAVIVYRLDRIARQTADYLAIRKKLAECEIVLISATEPTGNSPTEKFIETMLAGFAQMDNDVRSERTKNGMRARFLAGLHSGSVPLGYINQNGYATKDPETFDKMKAGWDLMATGTKSLKGMAETLNAQGLREKHNDHKEYFLRAQTLNGIFRNKFYTGKVISKRYGQEIQGQHPPMVTEEQFYQVQAVLDGRNRNVRAPLGRRNRDNTDFPLRRIVKCNGCGTSFTGGWSKGKHARYAYYFCTKRCGAGTSIPKNTIEKTLIEYLGTVSLTERSTNLLNSFLRTTYYQRVSTLQKKRDQADAQIKKLYEFRQALIEKNLSGIYSDDIFKEQNQMVEAKIKNAQIAKNDEFITKYNIEAITQFVTEKLVDLAKMYIDTKEDIQQKRVMLCSIHPLGMRWSYPGYSNTQKSPFYQAILDLEKDDVQFGAPGGI